MWFRKKKMKSENTDQYNPKGEQCRLFVQKLIDEIKADRYILDLEPLYGQYIIFASFFDLSIHTPYVICCEGEGYENVLSSYINLFKGKIQISLNDWEKRLLIAAFVTSEHIKREKIEAEIIKEIEEHR